MLRWGFLAVMLSLAACLAAPTTITGKLAAGKKPALATSAGSLIFLDGEAETMEVLGDARLNGTEVEVTGNFTAPDRFAVGPFHLNSLLVVKNGKKYEVTYWCDT